MGGAERMMGFGGNPGPEEGAWWRVRAGQRRGTDEKEGRKEGKERV